MITFFYVDPRIPCRIRAVAYDGNFKTVFMKAEITVNNGGNQHRYEQNGKRSAHLPAAECGKSRVLQRRHRARTVRIPQSDKKRYQANGDIIHHEGKERLVRIEKRLEYCGNERPYRPGDDARNQHQKPYDGIGKLASQIIHAHRAGKAAHEYLPVAAEVPELHFEGYHERHRDREKERRILQQDPYAPLCTEGALKERREVIEKSARAGRRRRNERRADTESDSDRYDTDQQPLPNGHAFPTGNMDQRFFYSCHVCPSTI